MILHLQEPNFEAKNIELTSEERNQYRVLEFGLKRAIDIAKNNRNSKGTHRTVLEALLRLRLFCNHGLDSGNPNQTQFPSDQEGLLSLLQQGSEAMCSYCYCDILEMASPDGEDAVMITPCQGLVCRECVSQFQSSLDKKYTCPLCKCEHNFSEVNLGDQAKTNMEAPSREVYPSKILALLEDVQSYYTSDKRFVSYATKSVLVRVSAKLIGN
jgi:SWI/SNF-related matrix-associated actin-dependent regulator of chromatin subfamily A3